MTSLFAPRPFLPANPYNSQPRFVAEALELGRQTRDELVWQFPALPGAIYTFLQMVTGREWRTFGATAAAAQRASDYLNETQTHQYDGIIEYGMEQFLGRRSLDHLCVGRKMLTWREGKPIRYLDPTMMRFELEDRLWRERYTGEEFKSADVVMTQPIAFGSAGYFIAPLAPVIPTAILSYLIREHDRAAADGRKIRDIMIVVGEDLRDQIHAAVEDMIAVHAGGDPTKIGVNVVHAETFGSLKAADMFARFGLANVPEGFDRSGFQVQYINEIAAAAGLAVRHFYNDEKAGSTNRALETVAEQRQQFKGPASFTRTEQRELNRCGALRQFGAKTRMSFIEEVDVMSRDVDANIAKTYAEAAEKFKVTFGDLIDGEVLVAWLQNISILPSDIELLKSRQSNTPDRMPTPIGGAAIRDSDDLTRSTDIPDYDEVVCDQSGKIVEVRRRVIHMHDVLKQEMLSDSDFTTKALEEQIKPDFATALVEARQRNLQDFKAKSWTDEDAQAILDVPESELTADHHRQIKRLLDKSVHSQIPEFQNGSGIATQ